VNITLQDLLTSLGAKEDEIDDSFCSDFKKIDFSYKLLEGKEKYDIILKILKSIDNDTQVIASEKRTEEWRNGWQENLDDFMATKDLSAVIPKYIRNGNVMRYNKEYILPNNPYFERDFFKLYQRWFLKKILNGCDNIYEFGCGSCINLVTIAQMFPDVHIVGTDFVEPPIKLAREIAKEYFFNIDSYLFNMIHPNFNIDLKDNSCILTCGAVEQLGGAYCVFIDYLLEKKPKICMHIEPIIEFYDENNLVDYMVIKFIRKRGYSQGFLPYLEGLEGQGKIEIIKKHRPQLGSWKLEGYNYIIWRPV
tara:strand:+ start:2552 stop:3472 length:921 start_codon:yes stop_codon:yes gene_type:complete